ncbi:WAS/WASL-interacting protein family member 1-like [Dipodomys merriami]|uniref:WAS/WASL-interacting protein family member 1-like n=1 Tax=Dipodomys merriami TaxID=94247 RepID=UPI003855D133
MPGTRPRSQASQRPPRARLQGPPRKTARGVGRGGAPELRPDLAGRGQRPLPRPPRATWGRRSPGLGEPLAPLGRRNRASGSPGHLCPPRGPRLRRRPGTLPSGPSRGAARRLRVRGAPCARLSPPRPSGPPGCAGLRRAPSPVSLGSGAHHCPGLAGADGLRVRAHRPGFLELRLRLRRDPAARRPPPAARRAPSALRLSLRALPAPAPPAAPRAPPPAPPLPGSLPTWPPPSRRGPPTPQSQPLRSSSPYLPGSGTQAEAPGSLPFPTCGRTVGRAGVRVRPEKGQAGPRAPLLPVFIQNWIFLSLFTK